MKKKFTKLQTNKSNEDNISLPENVKLGNDQSKTQNDDLPDIPVYHQGWLKYFRYLDFKGSKKPNKFFKNDAYMVQQKNEGSKLEEDQYGPKTIPDDKHFFGVIYKDSLNILNNRNNPLAQVVDSLKVDFMKTIPDDDNYMGAVKDFGSFSEGFCFQVSTIRPSSYFKMSSEFVEPQDGIKEVWLICTDTDQQKKQFMNILIKLKLKKQHDLGAFLYYNQDPNKSLNPDNGTLNSLKNGEEPINDPKRSSKDGYWILLQDWGSCTLKCGGGLQYQQLMCVPPKSGGKPCEGPAIRTRPCNSMPCPSVNTMQTILPPPEKKEEFEKPIVRMMSVSQRPQRYDKCYLKEGDALMIKSDKFNSDTANLPKIPVRIVMNNKTVTVYQDDSLQTNLASFVLRTTIFFRIEKEPRCFILKGNNEKVKFCQIDSSSGNFVDEWDYDFNLFKLQCHEKRSTYEIKENEETKLKQEYDNKVNQVKAEIVQEKAEVVKKQAQESEEARLKRKVDEAQATTLKAIQKETNLEELIEKEEAEKEQNETKQLVKEFEAEKKKNDCLLKSIKEKQMEDQLNLSRNNVEAEIEKIKEEAKKQIMIKRIQIKQKLALMKKKNERKNQQIKNDIMSVRMEVTGKMQQFAKQGDDKKCFNPKTINTIVEEYCQTNFPDSIIKFRECKTLDSFCYACCENEYGELHIVDRDNCYRSRCDEKPVSDEP